MYRHPAHHLLRAGTTAWHMSHVRVSPGPTGARNDVDTRSTQYDGGIARPTAPPNVARSRYMAPPQCSHAHLNRPSCTSVCP